MSKNSTLEQRRTWEAAKKARDPEGYRRKRSDATRRSMRKRLPEPTRSEPVICECCGIAPKNGRHLCLDHDHKTHRFRGWLCFGCNTAIGKLGDDLTGIERARAYLLRAEPQ